MKLLFIGYLHGYGGAERMIIQLTNAMVKRGHKAIFLVLSDNNSKYKFEEGIIKYVALDQSKNKMANLFRRRSAISKAINKEKPDLIINFWLQSAYLCLSLGKQIARKTIYAERGDPSDSEYSGLLGFLRNITVKNIRSLVFQSKNAMEFFDKSIQSKGVVIHNPVFVNVEEYSNIEKNKNRIISVGRLHPQKNQENLIRAFELVSKELPQYYLDIYGDGELRENLQNLIDELKLSQKVFLRGTTDKIYNEIASSCLFVLSSDYEGMPNVLLEAMALGVPCISTDYKPGSVPEIIEDGVSGIIVPINNSAKLAEAMIKILRNKDLQEKISNNGKKKMKEFTPDKIYSTWENYFTSLMVL